MHRMDETPQLHEYERRPFHSKYFGTPGSITALRLNYERSSHAYEHVEPNTLIRTPRARARIRQEVIAWKHASQLGMQPEWTSSVQPSPERMGNLFPKRALMHTLSAFQTTPLPLGFRDTKLPDLYQRTLYLPRTNKFTFDTSCFQGGKGTMLNSRCMSSPSREGTLNSLRTTPPRTGGTGKSIFSNDKTVMKGSNQIATLAHGKGMCVDDVTCGTMVTQQWNPSTTLPTERSMSSKAPLRKETSLRPLTRFIELRLPLFTDGRYQNPRKRVEVMNALRTEKKRAERAKACGGADESGIVYKLSNMHVWAHAGSSPAPRDATPIPHDN